MDAAPKLLIAATIPDTIRAFLLPYADYFRESGWRVDAMAQGITASDDLSGRFDRTFDAKWSRNPLALSNVTENTGAIRDIVASEGYDIVHAHTPIASFVTRLALRKYKSAPRPTVVYTAHGFHFYNGGPSGRNWIFRTLERMAGRWTDKLITMNREDFEAAKKYGIVPEENLIYMPGIGLDFSKYDPDKTPKTDVRQVRDQLGIKSEETLFALIGEFIPRKRHIDAINALSKLAQAGAHIAFAGEGPTKEKMRELALSMGLSKKIHFLGRLKDVNPLILASKAVLIPSEREGLSRTGMETACLGVPIIGSNAKGVRDIVQPGRGLLFPTGDIYAMRDAMQQIIEEGHEEIVPDEAWRVENLIKLHRELYERLLEKRGGDG